MGIPMDPDGYFGTCLTCDRRLFHIEANKFPGICMNCEEKQTSVHCPHGVHIKHNQCLICEPPCALCQSLDHQTGTHNAAMERRLDNLSDTDNGSVL